MPEALAAAPPEAQTQPRRRQHNRHHEDTTESRAAGPSFSTLGTNDQCQTISQETSQREVIDAATILEFIAWGRQKQVTYATDSTANNNANSNDSAGISCSPGTLEARRGSLIHLQILLPDPKTVQALCQYHIDCLLWYHGSFHGSTFMRQLVRFYAEHGGQIDAPAIDLQWVALLFSVLAASISCGSKATVSSWGFGVEEQEMLSVRWLEAVITCLDASNYMASQSVLSCQAISTLTISAHLLGYSDQQAILLAAATRIAQALGLHRLDDSSERTVEVEAGRRLWSQLCTQDFFSIPFTECYLINPVYSKSSDPLNCNDESLDLLPAEVTTVTSYCRFLSSIAMLMPQLQDGIEGSKTFFMKYEQVLKFDRRLRSLATEQRPSFLSRTPSEPDYAPWARRAAAISSSHKIIMIHRKFLSMSFTNTAFTFTRRTCIAASKTILKEFRQATDEDGPVLWIYHAFSVAASITLCLDILYCGSDATEHARMVTETVSLLNDVQNSKIASRGARLLGDLLYLTTAYTTPQTDATRKRSYEQAGFERSTDKQHKNTDIGSLLHSLQESMQNPTSENTVIDRAQTNTPQRLSTTSAPQRNRDMLASDGQELRYSEDLGQDFEANNAFAGADDILSNLHAGFAGSTHDAFGSLLNLSQSYSYG
ncbi:hypothetical protein LTR56_010730 [Elasticomyces elasticus]|nr:hypothetical protein LTR56_010730 [Elasticomyces elasticus]KAK3667754.1 hypothetical protein LTR22_001199 [Elasticomyces elasticus]KAK4932252.1 hypothetical protein LTR49_001549 [Elasticomyces elasticus]KAK5745577.1 hypothetical protein LTS12_023059 [Elasticomyces elasticus]